MISLVRNKHADVAQSQVSLELKVSPTVWIQLKFQFKTLLRFHGETNLTRKAFSKSTGN